MRKILMYILLLSVIFPYKLNASVDNIIDNMSNEDKIAMMLMPSLDISYSDLMNDSESKSALEYLINKYNFSGILLFGDSTTTIEETVKLTNYLQSINKNNVSRLIISIDQEGGYVVRLGEGTNTMGNMALAATNDEKNAYIMSKIIGKELKSLGINANFAPVVDVNNNPANPVIGVRSFSDDPYIVSKYASSFMKGLKEEEIITSLKHFPGHGDTDTDTHSGLAIINKTYDELKKFELIPFNDLLTSDMIMTAHIQFPNIEEETYLSKDGNTYTLPATLSKKFLTDILRNDMKYEGVIITDALNMEAVSNNFESTDVAVRAINAGANILLEPTSLDKLDEYIKVLANKIGNEINEDKVNDSVRRILKLKEEKGLLKDYEEVDFDTLISNAKKEVSTKENHDLEFDITKKSITLIKNDDNLLPLNSNKTIAFFYNYNSSLSTINNSLDKLINDKIIKSKDNISLNKYSSLTINEIKNIIDDNDIIVVVNGVYEKSDMTDENALKIDEMIKYTHENDKKIIYVSGQLPYDIARYNKADAIIATYLASGINFDMKDYSDNFPKYAPNLYAGIYKLFSNESYSGKLPVNVYKLDDNFDYTNEILYKRGYGITSHVESLNIIIAGVAILIILLAIILITKKVDNK